MTSQLRRPRLSYGRAQSDYTVAFPIPLSGSHLAASYRAPLSARGDLDCHLSLTYNFGAFTPSALFHNAPRNPYRAIDPSSVRRATGAFGRRRCRRPVAAGSAGRRLGPRGSAAAAAPARDRRHRRHVHAAVRAQPAQRLAPRHVGLRPRRAANRSVDPGSGGDGARLAGVLAGHARLRRGRRPRDARSGGPARHAVRAAAAARARRTSASACSSSAIASAPTAARFRPTPRPRRMRS